MLKPVDTFFFRGHKSLSPGEDSAVKGIFPPRPGTVYGALRSAYIHARSDFEIFGRGLDRDLVAWMGTPEQYGMFTIKGVFLFDGEEPLLPLPLDYQVVERGISGSSEQGNGNQTTPFAYPLRLREDDAVTSSPYGNWNLYGAVEDKSIPVAGTYLTLSAWKDELLQRRGSKVQTLENLLVSEQKLGIARDWESGRVIEGMLYQMEMQRFASATADAGSPGLVVYCRNAPDFNNIPYVRLGGKNRSWHLKILDWPSALFSAEERSRIVEQIKSTGLARIIFLTPALWDGGSLSAHLLGTDRIFKVAPGLALKLRTAAIGRPLLIGGWDLAKRRPKERMQAIPAGSVFYVEVEPSQAELLVETILENALTDMLAHEGYGLTVCGAANIA